MLQLHEVRELLTSSSPGDKVEVACEGSTARALKEEIPGLSWTQVTIGHFIFHVPELPMKSGKTLVFELLEKYDSGFLKLDMSENSARVYVSQFNKTNDTKFKVTMREGVPHVYADVSSKKYIRMSEYNAARDKAIEELNRLRAMVRPDEFFEMQLPEFDNGLPVVTESDFEPDIKPRGMVYVCDDCHNIIPEEQGEVDVCESCMEARDSRPGDDIEGSAVPMETAESSEGFTNDEIDDDLEAPTVVNVCEVCNDEFPTDNPQERYCDACRL